MRKKKIRANVFIEYALVLGTASMVFIAMNTYVKRGMQGKVKDITDYFVGDTQVEEVSPTALTKSNSETKANSNINRGLSLGGSTYNLVSESVDSSSESKVIDSDDGLFNPEFIGSEAGSIGEPEPYTAEGQ